MDEQGWVANSNPSILTEQNPSIRKQAHCFKDLYNDEFSLNAWDEHSKPLLALRFRGVYTWAVMKIGSLRAKWIKQSTNICIAKKVYCQLSQNSLYVRLQCKDMYLFQQKGTEIFFKMTQNAFPCNGRNWEQLITRIINYAVRFQFSPNALTVLIAQEGKTSSIFFPLKQETSSFFIISSYFLWCCSKNTRV